MNRHITRSLIVVVLMALVFIVVGAPAARAEDFDILEFSVNQAVPLNSSIGVAQITGTVHCSDYGSGEMWGELRQSVGRKYIIKGYFYTGFECYSESTQWSVDVVGDNGNFAPGKATVLATACVWGTIQGDVCSDARSAVRIKKSRG
jgi:hypothetical protein